MAKNGAGRAARATSGASESSPAAAPGSGDANEYAPECYACPIGTASMLVQRLRPETTEHFLRAGRELVLGLRALVDGLGEVLQTMEDRTRAARPIERIEIRRP